MTAGWQIDRTVPRPTTPNARRGLKQRKQGHWAFGTIHQQKGALRKYSGSKILQEQAPEQLPASAQHLWFWTHLHPALIKEATTMSCFFIADPRFAFTFLVELESHEQEGAVKQRKPILEPDFYGMPAIIGRSSKPHNQSKNNSAGLEE